MVFKRRIGGLEILKEVSAVVLRLNRRASGLESALKYQYIISTIQTATSLLASNIIF